MITSTESTKLKEILGKNYTKDVLSYMINQGWLNTDQKPYHKNTVISVMNGKFSNPDIESAIWQVAAKRLHQIKQADEVKDQLNQL